MKSVLVDIDDTIADTQTRILKYVNSHSPKPYEYRQMTRAFREGRELEYDALVSRFLGTPKLVAEIEPYAEALEAMKRLHSAGYEIHVASARKDNLHEVTFSWLRHHGFADYVTRIHPRSAALKGKQFKIAAAEAAGAKVAFDDTYDVAEALTGAGLTVYLIDKPWNRDEPDIEGAIRSASFSAAVEDFLEKSS